MMISLYAIMRDNLTNIRDYFYDYFYDLFSIMSDYAQLFFSIVYDYFMASAPGKWNVQTAILDPIMEE